MSRTPRFLQLRGNGSASVNDLINDDALTYALTAGLSQAYKPLDASYAGLSEVSVPRYTSAGKSHDAPNPSSGAYTYSTEPGPSMTPRLDEYSNITYTTEPVNEGRCMNPNFNRSDSASFVMNEGRSQRQEDELDITNMWRFLMNDPEQFNLMEDGLL